LGCFFRCQIAATLVTWIATALLHAVHWFADFPRWSYRIPGPPWLLVLLFFAVGFAFAAMLRLQPSAARWPLRTLCAALFACAVLVAAHPFAPQFQSAKLEVTVLDVGQGDSILVVSPRGHTLLIDGGGAFAGFPGHEQRTPVDPGEEAVSPYLWSAIPVARSS
jgi:competence protein ComEC